MLEKIKEKVFYANLELPKRKLVKYTWGNVSEIDRESRYIVIKPSGVNYENMTPDDMVIVDLDGNVIEGKYNPSSDTPTHIELYKKYEQIGGIVHTHSTEATSWAQAGRSIPLYGTTHADYFFGDIPCTREMTKDEIMCDYEKNTGLVIIETLENKNIDPSNMPGILCKNHGPFTWGNDSNDAVYHAVVLEEIARMALKTEMINKNVEHASDYIRDKHFFRKHGSNAYYGQTKK